MSFAEIVLRVAAAVGGWLIFIGHALTILALRQADCDPGATSPIPGTALFAVLSVLAVAGVGLGLPWRSGIRAFALLGLVLASFAAWQVAPAVASTTIEGNALCGAEPHRAPDAPDPQRAPADAADLDPRRRPAGAAALDPRRRPAGAAATDLERLWPLLQLGAFGGGALQALRYLRPVRSDALGERDAPAEQGKGAEPIRRRSGGT